MQILKKDAMELISTFPDKFDLEDFMYKLYLLQEIKQGEEDIKNNKYTTSNELRSEIEYSKKMC